ncbi:acyl-CoA thioesterase [Psychrobacter frigidicola]|uniref:Acyl-CoA thioesterase n=1 Tax=Psychrobacter frigidicola TaxID=45611 RepID=A0A5C7A1H1_9GAMM|nr:acyl-CoA thioesterase [Psychrobacter frigidicola]TXD97178.1 acyl-CoA thioesterase [Psychrobacter frigidicola]
MSATDSHEALRALANYPVIHHQPIHWGEMDAFSHLNNVVYYRYAESARIAYLQALGMFDGSMVTVLAQSSCQYLRPVTYPDTLLLGVRCQRLGTTSIVMEYSYYSLVQQAIVATAEAVVVRLDSHGKDKLPWTTEERARLLALEETVGHTPKL